MFHIIFVTVFIKQTTALNSCHVEFSFVQITAVTPKTFIYISHFRLALSHDLMNIVLSVEPHHFHHLLITILDVLTQ